MSYQSRVSFSTYPSHLLNAIALAGICGSLLMAFYLQIFKGELACPLCMLQRIGLMLVGLGLFLNVRFGPSVVHYAMIIVSSMVGASVSLRQDLLHIVPGTGGYGSTIFGYHLYTWGFVAFMAMILFTALMLVIDRNRMTGQARHGPNWLATGLGTLLIVIAIGNLLSNFLVCGFSVCTDTPTGYIFFR
jgi:disulfide bond formation protein DsbB